MASVAGCRKLSRSSGAKEPENVQTTFLHVLGAKNSNSFGSCQSISMGKRVDHLREADSTLMCSAVLVVWFFEFLSDSNSVACDLGQVSVYARFFLRRWASIMIKRRKGMYDFSARLEDGVISG